MLGSRCELALGSPPLGGPSSSKESNGVPYKREAYEIKWLRTYLNLVFLVVTIHSYTLPMFSFSFNTLSMSLNVHNVVQCTKFQRSIGMHGKEATNI
jgi:hypothetical protein